MGRERAIKAFRRQPTDRIPHCEIISCPAFIQYATGIDPWEMPRTAALKLLDRWDLDIYMVPPDDKPIPRLPDSTVFTDEFGRQTLRWGTEHTWHWDWGARFRTIDDVLKFDPLADLDFRWMEPVGWDLSVSVEELARVMQKELDGWRASNGDRAMYYLGFYNTLFMWPLLMFGWENLLEIGVSYPAEMERILRDYAQVSRKVFTAWSMTDLEVVYSHDDICYQRGAVFSPDWYRKYLYPYYEEFWSILKAKGKTVFFVSDGNIDLVADDIIACGADGCLSEVYTDWKAYKRKHPDKVLISGGDNRIVKTGDKDAIEKMVKEMVELGKDMPGYFFCVANHLPWDMPPQGIEYYLDACHKYGGR